MPRGALGREHQALASRSRGDFHRPARHGRQQARDHHGVRVHRVRAVGPQRVDCSSSSVAADDDPRDERVRIEPCAGGGERVETTRCREQRQRRGLLVGSEQAARRRLAELRQPAIHQPAGMREAEPQRQPLVRGVRPRRGRRPAQHGVDQPRGARRERLRDLDRLRYSDLDRGAHSRRLVQPGAQHRAHRGIERAQAALQARPEQRVERELPAQRPEDDLARRRHGVAKEPRRVRLLGVDPGEHRGRAPARVSGSARWAQRALRG